MDDRLRVPAIPRTLYSASRCTVQPRPSHHRRITILRLHTFTCDWSTNLSVHPISKTSLFPSTHSLFSSQHQLHISPSTFDPHHSHHNRPLLPPSSPRSTNSNHRVHSCSSYSSTVTTATGQNSPCRCFIINQRWLSSSLHRMPLSYSPLTYELVQATLWY